MIVQKYGGSSVATIAKIKAIAKNIKKTVHEKLIVVVSAMGKTTNKLIKKAEKINKTKNLRELDALLSTGEQQSASIMAMALCSVGIKAISLNGIQAGIKTSNNHTKAIIKSINTKKLFTLFEKFDCIVVAGFQGFFGKNEITTLGRGGSDTTAVALAASMNAKCEIYTDVEAIYSINPSLFVGSKKLKILDFNTALEMAAAGSKVLDERALQIAKKYGTKIYLGKTLENNHSKGTYVMNKNYMEQAQIKNISIRENIVLFNLQTNSISQIVGLLKNTKQNLEMLSINENKISFICKKDLQKSIEKSLKNVKNLQSEKIFENLSRITLVGFGFSSHPHIMEKIINSFKKQKISFANLYLTETTISFLVNKEKEREAIKALVPLCGI